MGVGEGVTDVGEGVTVVDGVGEGVLGATTGTTSIVPLWFGLLMLYSSTLPDCVVPVTTLTGGVALSADPASMV